MVATAASPRGTLAREMERKLAVKIEAAFWWLRDQVAIADLVSILDAKDQRKAAKFTDRLPAADKLEGASKTVVECFMEGGREAVEAG